MASWRISNYARLTFVDCGEPSNLVCTFPAVSVIEKRADARKVARWSSLSRSAVEWAVIVQTVGDV